MFSTLSKSCLVLIGCRVGRPKHNKAMINALVQDTFIGQAAVSARADLIPAGKIQRLGEAELPD